MKSIIVTEYTLLNIGNAMAGIIEFDWGSVAEEGELHFYLKTLQGESILFVNGDGLSTFQFEDEDALLSCDNTKRKILTNNLFESWSVGQIPQVRGFKYFALGNTCEKQMRAHFKKRTFKAPHPKRGKVAICTGTSIDPEPGVSLHGNCKQDCAFTKSCVGYTVNNHKCTLFGRISVEYEDINKANTRTKQNPVKKTEQDLKIKSSSSLIVDSKLVDVSANSKKERCEILKIGKKLVIGT